MKTDTKSKDGTILWLIDIAQRDLTLQTQLFPFLSLLAKANFKIEPIFISDPSAQRHLLEMATPANRRIEEIVNDRLSDFAKSSRVAHLMPPKIIPTKTSSIKKSIEELLSYAKGKNLFGILVATRARQGLQRFLVGSFAETLVLKAETPIITINPNLKISEKLDHIVVATDLEQDEKSFEKTLHFASTFKARLTLLHVAQLLYQRPEASFATGSSYFESKEKQMNKCKERLQKLVGLAANSGLEAEAVLLDDTQKNVAELIVDFSSETKADLIAMVSRKNTQDAFLMGSVARQVVRHASSPVWVVHA